MTKESSYHAQKLTKKDKKYIDDSFTNFIIFNTMILMKYPHHKEFAFKLYNLIKLKKTRLNFFSILFIMDELTGDVIKPELLLNYINEKSNVFEPAKFDNNGISSDSQIQKLNSRDLRENVLEKFEKCGYLHNYQGKEQIKKFILKHPGRKLSNETLADQGGKRSIYLVDKQIEQFKKLIKKPETANYLCNRISDNHFIRQIIRYRLKAEFHLATLDESVFLQLYKFYAEAMNKELSPNEIEEIKTICPLLQNIDDTLMEKILDYVIENIKIEKERFSLWILISGLLDFKFT
jgi:hypothetical protein